MCQTLNLSVSVEMCQQHFDSHCVLLLVCVVQHLSQKQIDTNIGKSTTLVVIYLPFTGRQHSEIVCIKLNEYNPLKSHFVSNTIKPIGSITLSSLAEFFFVTWINNDKFHP